MESNDCIQEYEIYRELDDYISEYKPNDYISE